MSKQLAGLFVLGTAFFASAYPAFANFDEGVVALQHSDYAKALESWQGDAQAGDARAQYSLGYLYQFGLGVQADIGAARDWYGKAAQQNNADALYALGLLAEEGKGAPRDLAQAMDYYKKAAAAAAGQAEAEYAVGRMILRGRGVARDPKEGVSWLKKAALHGNPAGQYMLASAYEAGWGVAVDLKEAYYWYRRAGNADQIELNDEDLAFEPKVALANLRHRLSAEDMANVEARLRKEVHPVKKTVIKEATAPKKAGPAAAPATQPVPAAATDGRTAAERSAAEDGLPGGALTRQP